MIDLYHGLSPNVLKVTIFLEEAGLAYRNLSVDISQGEQYSPEFLRISPNGKVPAIVDHAPADGGPPLALFESGAILQYLAEKTGRFLPRDPRPRAEAMQWLFWQMANLGPVAGQNVHFRRYAPQLAPGSDHGYARERYTRESNRLFGVLDHRLRERPFIAGEYGIADMACYPWASLGEKILGQNFEEFPRVKRWVDAIAARPAVLRAYDRNGREHRPWSASQDTLLKNFFNQTAAGMYARLDQD
ncbi:MAG: glutathione S-transferase N-terminal domain-containing protein [Gammaproteobacteria bacterium]